MPAQRETTTVEKVAALPSKADQRTARAQRLRHGPGRDLRVGLAVGLASFWLGLLWAVAIRPLNAPDETAYLQAVMQTRKEWILPEIHFDFTHSSSGEAVGTPGDAAARAYITSAGISNPIQLLAYQNVQPPLYFLMTGLALQLLPADPPVVLYASRVISALFGAGIVVFCWAATRQLAPRAPMWAAVVAGVVALLPEFCFNNARVGNDSLVNCLGAGAFYVWFRGLREPGYDRRMLLAGGVVGLAILAKLNGMVLVPGLALVVLFRAFQGRQHGEPGGATLRRGAGRAAGAAGSLVLVCGWWFVRNVFVYGEPSGTAAANLFWKMNLPGINWADPAARWEFVQASWMSFWGFFGWQTIPLPDVFYQQALPVSLLLLGLSGLAGLGVLGRQMIRRRGLPAYVWQAGALMVLTAVLLIASFVQYSLDVALSPQGRYLYLAILPAALLFTGGLYALPPGRALKTIALSIPILWLAAMNVVGLALVR